MKDIPRLCLVCFFRVLRRFTAIRRPSKQRIIVIDPQGRLVNKWWGGEGGTGGARDLMRARLLAELFETLLVIDAACENFLTYN